MQAFEIIDQVQDLLKDPNGVRWSISELLNWLNAGQRAIVRERPDASMVTTAIPLTTGTKQTLPAAAIRLIDITRNMGGGATAGKAIRRADRATMDEITPAWHNESTSSEIDNYVYDDRNPNVFYVTPPARAGIYVEAMYSVAPTQLDDTNDTLSINEIYADIIVDYMMYRALSKDSEDASNNAAARSYLSAFNTALGIKSQVDAQSTPNQRR